MNDTSIGKNIAKLRKEKGITQEALAEIVGLTGQAVSKWESGGSPDALLLPVIAEYFEVSIDRLFGRKTNDLPNLQAGIAELISNLPLNERLRKVFDLCFTMELAIAGTPPESIPKSTDELQEELGTKQIHSQMFLDEGDTALAFDNALRYFLIMPEPEEGWSQRLHFKEEYSKLFSFLADDDVLKVLFFLYSRDSKKLFTTKLLEKELGLNEAKAVAILNELSAYQIVAGRETELDDEIKIIYEFYPNFAFIAFLAFAEELICKPNSFYYYSNPRGDKPYMGTKSKKE